jgi:hypothetical protein
MKQLSASRMVLTAVLAGSTLLACDRPSREDDATAAGGNGNGGGDGGSSSPSSGTGAAPAGAGGGGAQEGGGGSAPADPPKPWNETEVTAEYDSAERAAVDAEGNVLVAFRSSPTYLSPTYPRETLQFRKYSPGGSVLWSTPLQGTGFAHPMGIVADHVGDVFVSGVFVGQAKLDGTQLTSVSDEDVFLAKLSGVDGTPLWIKTFGGEGPDWSTDLESDGTDVFVVGNSFDAIDFGGPVHAGRGAFVARLAGADGGHVWSNHYGGESDFLGVALDSQKNIWLGGELWPRRSSDSSRSRRSATTMLCS